MTVTVKPLRHKIVVRLEPLPERVEGTIKLVSGGFVSYDDEMQADIDRRVERMKRAGAHPADVREYRRRMEDMVKQRQVYANDVPHIRWGEVISIGEGVTLVKEGDRVLVNSLIGQVVADDLIVMPDQGVLAT